MDRVVLAYNGSLDSTLCIHWLKEHNDMEVIALVVDLGLDVELDDLAEKAIFAGAFSCHFEVLSEEFCLKYVKPSLFAGIASVEGDPLAAALGRPIICKTLVETAKELGATHLSHGCKPNSDDSIRFDNCLSTLAPGMRIIQPLKEWNLKTREQKLIYARNHQLNISQNDDELDLRSIDGNIWGHILYRKTLDNTWSSSPDNTRRITTPLSETPLEAEQIIIEYKHGVPTSINNKKYSFKDILKELNLIGQKHGVGYIDTIGHKIKGLKNRKIIECPGATILTQSHNALEFLTLDREILEFKRNNIMAYRRLVRQGHWFSQYREILDNCFKQCQLHVTGEVRVELFHGQVRIVGRRSPNAMSVESTEITGIAPNHTLRSSSPYDRKKQ
jgi:argininosuccinate synthase